MKSLQKTIQIDENYKLNYLLYLPDDYDSNSQDYPLLMFLHGRGERGDDLSLVEKHGLAQNIADGKNYPFIVIAPQCPLGVYWDYYQVTLEQLLTQVADAYRVDESRVYLTGLSMGGAGTWLLATAFPHRFAAIVPICGRGRYEYGFPERLQRITHLPVWAFHGTADTVVPAIESEKLVEALNNFGGKAKLTLYPDVDHNSWTQTYNNPAIYEWLLSHTIAVEK